MSKPFGEYSGSEAMGLLAITVILPVKTSTRAILSKLQYWSERGGSPGLETHWGAHPGGRGVEQAPSSWLAPTAITSPLGDHERPPPTNSGKPRLSVLSASTRWAPVATSSTQTLEKYAGVEGVAPGFVRTFPSLQIYAICVPSGDQSSDAEKLFRNGRKPLQMWSTCPFRLTSTIPENDVSATANASVCPFGDHDGEPSSSEGTSWQIVVAESMCPARTTPMAPYESA